MRGVVLAVVGAAVFLCSRASLAETVQERVKIGDNVEGMTWAGQVQTFESNGALRILAGASLFDAGGHLLHAIDQGALALTDRLAGVTWIGGDRYVALDGDTSTLVVFAVP